MKKYIKISILLVVTCTYLFFGKISLAAYLDEGVDFYSQQATAGYVTEGIAFSAFNPQAPQPIGTIAIYRYYNKVNGDHFYTKNNSLANANYTTEGISFYAYNTEAPGLLPVFRFYNMINGDHFYTTSIEEKNIVINNPQWNYIYEHIEFYTLDTKIALPSDAVPIFRLYNPRTGDHFYTASENEKDIISASPIYRFYNKRSGDHFYTTNNTAPSSYISEGVAFYAYKNQISNSFPVYRYYNNSNGDHFYTTSNETPNNYISEGVAFYAYKNQSSNSLPVFRFYNTKTGDHFYTISESERMSLITPPLGPEISVGLWYYSKTGIQGSHFQISANKTYNIKDSSGNILTQVGADVVTTIDYKDSDNLSNINGNFSVSNSFIGTSIINKSIQFDSADGDNTNLIFETNRSSYVSDWRGTINHYRGKIKVQYYRGLDIFNNAPVGSSDVTQIWINNILPLEQYTWGAAETNGTGNINHTKVMTTAFRTYGFRYSQLLSTTYSPMGFKIRSDGINQFYGGYDWGESRFPNVRKATEQTRGVLVTYSGNPVITPYSSWSDGNTRTYGSSRPWCQAKSDPYGNRTTSDDPAIRAMNTDQLIAAGNHMYGLIAWGSVHMSEQGWDWQNILRYYYTNINLPISY